MDRSNITFLPGLFKRPGNVKVKADDPFIGEEVLQEYCSIFAATGVPSNIREDPYVAEIIKFSEEDLNEIAQVQIQRETQAREAHVIEEKERAEQVAAEQKIKQNLDHKVDKIFEEKAFYLKKQCPVKIPYKSSLTHEEHAAYLRAFFKFRIRPAKTATETAEYENYLSLQHRVYEEQKSFMQFSHQVARLELQTYNTVPEVIAKYISEYVQHRSKRVFRYKEYYVSEQQVPICPQDPENNLRNLVFTHVGNILNLGTLPKFRIPNKLQQYTLKIDDSISKREHNIITQSLVQDKNVLNDTPVSADNNAEYLAQQHQANLVISASAMKVLADNHGPNFDKEWDIPVEVKSYSVTDPDGRETQHRVVYIDKPMPKKIWTSLEKKQLYFKKAFLANFTDIKHHKMFRMKNPALFMYSEADKSYMDDTSRTVAEYDDNFFDLSYATDSDVFGDKSVENRKFLTSSKKRKLKRKGTNMSPEKCTKLEKSMLAAPENITQEREEIPNGNSHELKLTNAPQKSGMTHAGEHMINATVSVSSERHLVKESSVDKTPTVNTQSNLEHGASGSSSENFLESLLSMQDSLLKPLQTQSDPNEVNKDETSAAGRIPPRPWTYKLYTDWKKFFEPQVCPDWTGKNVHYQLFSLESSACQSSSSFQSMRILVRSKLHGLSYFKSDKSKSKPYVAYPKIESQAYFGCEVSTLSEITQQWVQLLVRPNTSLLQVRVCEGSGEILMTEERDMAAILKEGKQLHVGFSPHPPLATLYSVFSAVLGQPTGHYLLHHDPKTEAFIQLLKAGNPNKETNLHIYNLRKEYAVPSVSTRLYTVPPWLAIDTHVLSPFHVKHRKIPGTFPMNNPKKKLTKREKRKIAAKAEMKKTLQDLDKEKKEELTIF